MKTDIEKAEVLTEAFVTIGQSRDKIEATRDMILAIRSLLSLEDEGDLNYLQRLFEGPFVAEVQKLSLTAREALFYDALATGGSLLSIFNEYATYMDLAKRVLESPNTNFERTLNPHAVEVAEANNPIGAAYAVFRKNKTMTSNQAVGVLEAAHPLATNGLDEDTRDYLYELAADRGVTSIEIANVYGQLVDLVMAIRFSEDDDTVED